MDVRLDDDVHTPNAIQWYLFVLVISPIAHLRHVFPTRVVLFVALRQYDILVQTVGEFEPFGGLLP